MFPIQTIKQDRSYGLQSNLHKRTLFDEYYFEINKLLYNGYAKNAPADITLAITWYIPHHCVPSFLG